MHTVQHLMFNGVQMVRINKHTVWLAWVWTWVQTTRLDQNYSEKAMIVLELNHSGHMFLANTAESETSGVFHFGLCGLKCSAATLWTGVWIVSRIWIFELVPVEVLNFIMKLNVTTVKSMSSAHLNPSLIAHRILGTSDMMKLHRGVLRSLPFEQSLWRIW